jgi:uncharacterized protein YukE
MARVEADPEELRRFAARLRAFSGDLRERERTLRADLQRLGESWKDEQFNLFAEAFREFSQPLGRFLDGSDRFVEYLVRDKAVHLEEFQRRGRI